MKYLFYSQYGESIFLARAIAALGHEVHFYISNAENRLIGKDMGIEICSNFYMQLDKMAKLDTVIVFDATGKGDEADFLRDKGFNVVGGCSYADRLEDERDLPAKEFAGILEIPPTKSFSSFDEALGFLKGQKYRDRFVFKPDGADTPKSWTYVSKNLEDMVSRIDFYKANWSSTAKVHFQLQLFIEGIECDFGGWRSSKFWYGNSFEWYFEDKKQQNGNLGPAVGCASAFEYFTGADEPYYQRYLSRVGEILSEHSYAGNFSINNIFDPKTDKFYMLEVNPRFGYDALQNQCFTLLNNKKDPALLLDACATGKALPKGYFPTGICQFNVRFYVPPYPDEEHAKSAKGDAINYDPSVEKNLMLYDVYYNKESKQKECAGVSGFIGTMCANGRTPDAVIQGLYTKLMPKLDIAEVAYRTDGGKRVKNDIKELRQYQAIL